MNCSKSSSFSFWLVSFLPVLQSIFYIFIYLRFPFSSFASLASSANFAKATSSPSSIIVCSSKRDFLDYILSSSSSSLFRFKSLFSGHHLLICLAKSGMFSNISPQSSQEGIFPSVLALYFSMSLKYVYSLWVYPQTDHIVVCICVYTRPFHHPQWKYCCRIPKSVCSVHFLGLECFRIYLSLIYLFLECSVLGL